MGSWPKQFRSPMREFEMRRPPCDGEVGVSIKVRAKVGCFHRSCCPHAYALIDEHLHHLPPPDAQFAFQEHESGPEILAYVVVGVGLAKSVIELVTAIIKARSEGAKKGDRHSEPVELIVRRTVDDRTVQDEFVMRFDQVDPVRASDIQQALGKALDKLLHTANQTQVSTPPDRRTKSRRKRSK